MRRVRVLIKGVVQGVFFRANTEEKAKALGLKGYVKNIPEGVEAIFEGEDDKVGEILSFCAVGPEGAKVSTIDVTEESYSGEYKDFKIEY
ncbi:MAG: acylphosphatase [Nanoarchaeota archaeon]|nr:acylphosphatase [Nanoarchaeota archaeon]